MSDAKFELPFQFVNALRHARNRFEKHPHWKRLEGTPWENDASVIGADLMSDVARAYEAHLALLESVLAEAGEALEPFRKEAKEWADRTDLANDYEIIDRESCAVMFSLGDLRRAASVSNQIAGMKENGK